MYPAQAYTTLVVLVKIYAVFLSAMLLHLILGIELIKYILKNPHWLFDVLSGQSISCVISLDC